MSTRAARPSIWKLPAHPVADVWPTLTAVEEDALAASIRETGLLHPLVIWRDAKTGRWYLLDGRNRRTACKKAGVEPAVEVYEGSDPAVYVLAANEHRRHSTPSQRAMAVALTATAKVGGDHSAKMRNGEATSADAAIRGSVSVRLVEACRYVRDHAPDLVDAVLAGTIKAAAAEAEARRQVREAARKLLGEHTSDDLEDLARDAPDLADLLADEDADQQAIYEEYAARVIQDKRTVQRWNDALEGISVAVMTLRTVTEPESAALIDRAARHDAQLDRGAITKAREALTTLDTLLEKIDA